MSDCTQSDVLTCPESLTQALRDVVFNTPVLDMHTHICSADFNTLLLWGVDELVTYHYLIAEVCRAPGGPSPVEYYAMTKTQQADLIWKKLFVEAAPVSEACRGVLTTLKLLGIEVGPNGLQQAREYFADVTVHQHIDKVFELANVSRAVMTNDPFDAVERPVWLADGCTDDRFIPALRLDGILVMWQRNWETLRAWGYDVTADLNVATYAEVQRFLRDEITRMKPAYMAVSLSESFKYPADEIGARLIEGAVLPVATQTGTPVALMVGVKRQLNPALVLAGDGVGKSDICAVERICAENPAVRFFVTLLSRENQHELCVAARKLSNLMPFGCWWFLNNPSLIEEMTRMRLELLGLSMIPQHSDARILDQLIYKWQHSREIIFRVLLDKYLDLQKTGWPITSPEIKRDVTRLFSENFQTFAGVE